MLKLHFFLIALLVLLANLAPSRAAFAESPPKASVVVVVDPSAGLDAIALRKAVGDELHMDAIAPEDARASAAIGTISVAANSATKKLVVSYRAHTPPITREVPLPSDATATMREAVLLAGNLARDEASELADDLRKRAPKPAAPKAPGTPITDLTIDAAKLDAALAYQAGQARTARHVFGATMLGLGAASIGSAIYIRARAGHETDFTLGGMGLPLVIFGTYALASTSDPESLWILRQQGERADTIEARWAKMAETEHTNRRNASVFALVVGAAALTYGTIQSVYAATASSPSDYAKVSGPVSLLGGALFTLMGVYGLASDGPTEASLRLYERGIGRTITPEALASRFRLAIVPGGAVAGFGGNF